MIGITELNQMAGTQAGGRKAAAKIKARNPEHYHEIGHKGGKAGNHSKKGFAVKDPEYVAEMGRKGYAARINKPNHEADI
jgi:general stress protein YciG